MTHESFGGLIVVKCKLANYNRAASRQEMENLIRSLGAEPMNFGTFINSYTGQVLGFEMTGFKGQRRIYEQDY